MPTPFAYLYDIEKEKILKVYNTPQNLPFALANPVESTQYPQLPPNEKLYVVDWVYPDGNDYDNRLYASQDVVELTDDTHPTWVNFPTWRVTWNKVRLPNEEIVENAAQIMRMNAHERRAKAKLLEIPGVEEAIGDVFDSIIAKKLFDGVSLNAQDQLVVRAVKKIGNAARADLVNLIQMKNQIEAGQTPDLDANWQPTDIDEIPD